MLSAEGLAPPAREVGRDPVRKTKFVLEHTISGQSLKRTCDSRSSSPASTGRSHETPTPHVTLGWFPRLYMLLSSPWLVRWVCRAGVPVSLTWCEFIPLFLCFPWHQWRPLLGPLWLAPPQLAAKLSLPLAAAACHCRRILSPAFHCEPPYHDLRDVAGVHSCAPRGLGMSRPHP